MLWYHYIITCSLIGFVIFQLSIRFVYPGQIETLICTYYDKKQINVIDFLNISFMEKVQLGIPANLIHDFILSFFSMFFMFGANHYRKVITEDKNGLKQERILRLFIRNRRLKKIKEMRVLDF